MKERKRKLNYLLVIILLLLVSIGYAVLSTNLNILGSSQISAPSWDIHWENVQVKTGSVSASTPTIDTNKTTVNYSVTLTIPGEYYEFTVDAVNAGTIDGMVSVVSNKLNNVEITTLPNYLEYSVTYEDGIDIAPNHLLASNSSEKYKVHVGYKKDISVSDIPSTAQTLNLTFSVTYVQSDSNAIINPHLQTVYTANVHYGNWGTADDETNTSIVWIGKSIPNGIMTYQTPELAMAALKEAIGGVDRPFFLKHSVSNNTVTDSYVGFVITPEMALANPGMTAGTYTLKGGVNERVSSNKPIYVANKQVLLSAFGSTHCNESDSYCNCFDSDHSISIYAASDGNVYADDFYWFCLINQNGGSACVENTN